MVPPGATGASASADTVRVSHRPHRPWRARLLVAGALVAAGSLTACSSTHSTDSVPGGTGYQATSAHGGLLAKRQAAPDLHGPLIGGGTLDLATLRGKIVVLNFYASWCSPCRAETPLLVATAHAQAAHGVAVVGVLFKDSAANGAAFRRTFGATYPSLIDTDGEDLAKFRDVDPSAVPVTFVLDRAGRVAARYVGGITASSNFDAVLSRLVGEPA